MLYYSMLLPPKPVDARILGDLRRKESGRRRFICRFDFASRSYMDNFSFLRLYAMMRLVCKIYIVFCGGIVLNRKIGMYSSIINVCSVIAFALCMLIGFNFGSFFSCMFIAFSFVPMMCAFSNYGTQSNRVAGYVSMIFSGIYAVMILLVYFAQLTAVRLDGLNEQALQILDYSKFGLLFSYDLLGYGLMALSTFFAALTIEPKTKSDKWLKWFLLIHGVFFICCLIMPMLGLFHAEMQGVDWIGTLVLEFWCVYFAPVGVLSFLHFKNKA